METKLPQKYNFSFINKIKNFFVKIFFKEKTELKASEEKLIKAEKIVNNKMPVENSIEEMRKLSTHTKLKEDILELVQKNPQVIENLSEEKLDKLDKLCDEKIKENDKKIEQLKNKHEKLHVKVS